MKSLVHLGQVHEWVQDALFPCRCLGCGRQDTLLCESCAATLVRIESPICPVCGLPLGGETHCQDCRNMPVAIDGIRSVYRHSALARDAVRQLKYNNLKAMARPLAGLMARYLESCPIPADVIAAIPMHPKRIRQRGYNQADLLAKELAAHTGIPLSRGELTRSKNTASQVSLSAEDRLANVEGAFACCSGAFGGRQVLLIDDVCTTGATLNACAAVLKRSGGALSVWGLTLSREC